MRDGTWTGLSEGTNPDLIEGVRWRARFEVSRGLNHGLGAEAVRRAILDRFRGELLAESFGEYADEMLMAALQREIEDCLDSAIS
jgi:hypothetical protein